MQQKTTAWQALQQIQAQLQELQTDLQTKTSVLAPAVAAKEQLKLQEQQSENQVMALEKELVTLVPPPVNQAGLNKQRDALSATGKVITAVEHYYRDWTTKQQEITALEQKNSELQQTGQHYEQELKIKHQNKTALVTAIENLAEQCQETEQANQAVLLSEQLKANQPCPVCGSLNHPRPVVATEQHRLLPVLKEHLEQQKTQLQIVEGEINNLNTFQAGIVGQLQPLRDNIVQARNSEKLITGKINEKHSSLGAGWPQADLKSLQSAVVIRQNELNTAQTELDKYAAKKEHLTKALATAQSKLHQARQQLVAAVTRVKGLQDEQQNLTTKLNKIKPVWQNQKQAFIALAGGLSGEQIEWQEQQMQQVIKVVAGWRQKEKKITQALEELVNNLSQQQARQKDHQKELEVLAEAGRGYQQQLKELAAKIKVVTQQPEQARTVPTCSISYLFQKNICCLRTFRQENSKTCRR